MYYRCCKSRWTTRLWIAPTKPSPDCRRSRHYRSRHHSLRRRGVRAVRDLKALYPHKIVLAAPKLPMRAKSFLACASKPTLLGDRNLLCGYQHRQRRAGRGKEFNGDVQIELTGYWTWEQGSSGATQALGRWFITAAVTRGRRRGVGRSGYHRDQTSFR